MELEKLKKIKALLFDVDGVLTDGNIYYTNEGDEIKRFNVKDGLAITRLREMGYILGAITGRESKIVERRMTELGVHFTVQGSHNKTEAYDRFKDQFQFEDHAILYTGDDLNDLPVLLKAGFSCTPADGNEEIKARVDYTCSTLGGKGVVREVAELVFRSQNRFDEFISPYI